MGAYPLQSILVVYVDNFQIFDGSLQFYFEVIGKIQFKLIFFETRAKIQDIRFNSGISIAFKKTQDTRYISGTVPAKPELMATLLLVQGNSKLYNS